MLVGGRVKPLDTVARNSLLIIHGKQTLRLRTANNSARCTGSPTRSFNAPVADQYPVFVIQNADVLGLFGWEQSDRKYFSFAELTPFLRQIDEQGAQSEKLRIGSTLGLSERNPQPAQWPGPLSAPEEQRSAGGRAEISPANWRASKAVSRRQQRRRANAKPDKISTNRNSTMWRS